MPRRPELYLSLEAAAGPACRDRLAAALAASPIASVRLMPRPGGTIEAAVARTLIELIQSRGVAALIDTDAELARTFRADGVHLPPGQYQPGALAQARDILGARHIVGAEVAQSRHAAMALAETGADYIAFSGPERDGLVAWWGEIFEVPCVALGVTSVASAVALAKAGADFIGIDIGHAASPADTQALVRGYAAAWLGGAALIGAS